MTGHPTGKSVTGLCSPLSSPFSEKYFCFTETQITLYTCVPSHRGALRNVINAGRDAVDAEGA